VKAFVGSLAAIGSIALHRLMNAGKAASTQPKTHRWMIHRLPCIHTADTQPASVTTVGANQIQPKMIKNRCAISPNGSFCM